MGKSSGECLAMAQKFQSLKGALGGLYGPISTCVGAISSNETAMNETVISNKPLDDGKLTEAKGSISAINGDISTMQAECDAKYQYWMDEYYAALDREEEAKKEKKWWQF